MTQGERGSDRAEAGVSATPETTKAAVEKYNRVAAGAERAADKRGGAPAVDRSEGRPGDHPQVRGAPEAAAAWEERARQEPERQREATRARETAAPGDAHPSGDVRRGEGRDARKAGDQPVIRKDLPELDLDHDFKYLEPTERADAELAREAYANIANFKNTFEMIDKAANRSALDPASKDQLRLIISKEVSGPLRDFVSKEIAPNIATEALEKLLGRSFSGPIEVLLLGQQIETYLKNERTLSDVSKVGLQRYGDEKVRLWCEICAKQQAQQLQREHPTPHGYNPEKIKLDLYNNYQKFREAHLKYKEYLDKDLREKLRRTDPESFKRLSDRHPKLEQG